MPSLPRILAIMGSGETAPTMVSIHQELFSRLPASARAVLIETPYGFQENADEISDRTATYFARNVGRTIEVVGMRTDADADEAAAVARLQAADYVFAGPGSPTYALDRWRGSSFADAVTDKLQTGGIVVFASAAAVSLGRHAIPVYEIYKVGRRPHWVEGLDLLAAAGIDAAVIPHFDNAEGGTHDTRFCYLGARRLTMMEDELPDDTLVIGVDEHTALILDLDERIVTIQGRGYVTVRRGGQVLRVVDSGVRLALDGLTASQGTTPPAPVGTMAPASASSRVRASSTSTLREATRDATTAFGSALAHRDGVAAATAILDLDAAITAWAADTTQSDEGDRARATLRGLIVRLGEAATQGLADPAERLAPLIDAVAVTRQQLRGQGAYGLADDLRDAVGAVGVELRDTPDGTTWRVVSD
ncbi:MAG TPA: Type 1 glutamine amidotransferase-like domain-containing protein [Euzebyales bacterium]|nr:Type 1 glutamine amidotransferase-like domain-containing protein [Euzebyales bacterium]